MRNDFLGPSPPVLSLALAACGETPAASDRPHRRHWLWLWLGAPPAEALSGTSTSSPIDYPVPRRHEGQPAGDFYGIGVGNDLPCTSLSSAGALRQLQPDRRPWTAQPVDPAHDSLAELQPPTFTFQDLYYAGNRSGEVNADTSGQNITGQAFPLRLHRHLEAPGASTASRRRPTYRGAANNPGQIERDLVWQKWRTLASCSQDAQWLSEGRHRLHGCSSRTTTTRPCNSRMTSFNWVNQAYQTNYLISIDAEEVTCSPRTKHPAPGGVT